MIFARRVGSANVTSLQERQSRFVILISNDDKRASTITKGINAQLAPLPGGARRTITLSRGTEFLDYPAFPMKAWFCDPYSPWQKGGIENAKGRLRRFLPLDSASGERSAATLSPLAEKINATPRRCLNYRTPNEVFAEALSMITLSE